MLSSRLFPASTLTPTLIVTLSHLSLTEVFDQDGGGVEFSEFEWAFNNRKKLEKTVADAYITSSYR